MKLGNLAARVLTAIALAPLLILAVSWQRPEALWGIIFVAALISLHEFFTIASKDRGERMLGIVLGGAVAWAAYYWPGGIALILTAALLVSAIFFLARFGELATVTQRMGTLFFGVVYAGLMITYVALAKRDLGSAWVYLIFMIAWFGDTAAYFAGRFMGKRKLYPAISPGKTWAGAVGGLAGSFLAAVIANSWLLPELGWVSGALLTIIGGALGQCGDLVESMLKRSAGVKDSGKLLPGHGGLLDRIDAVLFIAPWVYFYALFLWR